jgi:mRNA interferase YafQ
MYTIRYRNKFKKNLAMMMRRGKDPEKIRTVIIALAVGHKLDPKYRDHSLGGDLAGFRDCHIEPDWLLIYRVEGDTLYLERTGTHSDLFKK